MKCLDNITMQKFINNNLNEKEKKDINLHFAKCTYCLDIYETATSYIDENEFIEFVPVCKSFAENILKEISYKLPKKQNLSKSEAKQKLISYYNNFTQNKTYIIHNWIKQSIILPCQAQFILAPVFTRSSGTLPQKDYNSIVIQKQLSDFTIEICFIKDIDGNNFHILAKNSSFLLGQSIKRLYFYKNDNLLNSSLLIQEYQYIKKQPAGIYKFIIGTNIFEMEISDEKLYEK